MPSAQDDTMATADRSKPGLDNAENDAHRLRRVTSPDAMSVQLVSAIAGDRALTEDEAVVVVEQQECRGRVYFSDLLYAVTHHYFAPEVAEDLWAAVLLHKSSMPQAIPPIRLWSHPPSEMGCI